MDAVAFFPWRFLAVATGLLFILLFVLSLKDDMRVWLRGKVGQVLTICLFAVLLSSAIFADLTAPLQRARSNAALEEQLTIAQTENRRLEEELAILKGQIARASDQLKHVESMLGMAQAKATGAKIANDLNKIIENASVALANVSLLEANAPSSDLVRLRESMLNILRSAQATAEKLDIEMAPAPAAGPREQDLDSAPDLR